MPIVTRSNSKTEPEIILTFDEGKVIKETVGFEGKSCTEATAFIEAMFKARNQKITFKPEYLRGGGKTERKLTA